MRKTIVTHFNPDLDAVCSVWLIKRFLAGWEKAEVQFVPPGEYTIDDQPVDSQPNILYVDTGRGKLDHHQTNDDNCSATLTWEFIGRETKINDRAIERMLKVVNDIDHARDLVWPEADNDRYELTLHMILEGFKRETGKDDNSQRIIEFGLEALDGVYQAYREKISAEEELERGIKFQTRWGKAIAVETSNNSVIFLAEKKSYSLVVRLSPVDGYLKIYGRWDRDIDLTHVWQELKRQDPEPFWFLHASKVIVMNGTPNQPDYKPTKLSLNQIIRILQEA